MAVVARMKMLLLCPYPENTAPSQRFRFEQQLGLWRRKGIQVDVSPSMSRRGYRSLATPNLRRFNILMRAFAARSRDVARARSYDLVFVHREAFPVRPPIIEEWIRRRNRHIVYDFDDSLHLVPDHRRRRGLKGRILEKLEYPDKCREILKISSRVIVGNAFLQAYASKYNPDATIIPTSIDTDAYQPKLHKKKADVCIGWSGSY